VSCGHRAAAANWSINNMLRNRMPISLVVPAVVTALACPPVHAATPEEAFKAGCGGCHSSDNRILREIPRGSEEVRRAWILKFMAGHPNEKDAVKAEIVEYLVARSATSKSWWQFW
jgi:hypothetical protein